MRRKLTAFLIILAGSMAAGVWLVEHGYLRFNYPDREEFPMWGIDVSHHNGAIDWKKVAAKRETDFAFIKATEGGDWIDPRFKENWSGARAAGIASGAYHFYSLCKSGKEQAENFIRNVPRTARALPAVADLEFGGNCKRLPPKDEVLRELRDWSTRVGAHFGREPIFYVTLEFYDLYLGGGELENALWVRSIFKEPERPEWLFWQFANRGRVEGIGTPVDLNAFCCDRAAWEKLKR